MSLFEPNVGILDMWTLVHLGAGFFIGWLLYRKGTLGAVALFLIVALFSYELIELARPDGFGGAENGLNMLSDVVIGVLGGIVGFLVSHGRKNK